MSDRKRKPDWLKIRLPEGKKYRDIKDIVNSNKLHTICSSGKCPNIGECWGIGTATFMIGGDVCTRSCKFCATKSGRPKPLDTNEPVKIAQSISLMKLKHCVITSVDRDDLEDGGASHWVKTVKEIQKQNKQTTIEILVPDFDGKRNLIDLVIQSGANIVSHNIETTRQLTNKVRSRAKYDVSLEVIRQVAASDIISKSGLMLGLGETESEVYETIYDLASVGCEIITIGQYLQPTKQHLEVAEYVNPKQFNLYREYALKQGIKVAECGPLVRSSYHAEKHLLNK